MTMQEKVYGSLSVETYQELYFHVRSYFPESFQWILYIVEATDMDVTLACWECVWRTEGEGWMFQGKM